MNMITISDVILEKQMAFFFFPFFGVSHIMKLSLMSVKMVCAGSALSGNKFRVELNPMLYKTSHLVITYKLCRLFIVTDYCWKSFP